MITTGNLGKHEAVLFVTFGTGDVKFTRGKYEGENTQRVLMFSNNSEPKEIGEVSFDDAGKSTDEIDPPSIVFEFTKPESITALIHSLIELQKDVFAWDGKMCDEKESAIQVAK